MRLFTGAVIAFCVLAVDLVMGLPTYGLVGTLRTGRDPLATDGGMAQVGLVMLCGIPWVLAFTGLCLWMFRERQ